MTGKPRPKSPLQRLQEHGELTLQRSSWCAQTPGKRDDWYEVLDVKQGLAMIEGKTLRPVKEPAGR